MDSIYIDNIPLVFGMIKEAVAVYGKFSPHCKWVTFKRIGIKVSSDILEDKLPVFEVDLDKDGLFFYVDGKQLVDMREVNPLGSDLTKTMNKYIDTINTMMKNLEDSSTLGIDYTSAIKKLSDKISDYIKMDDHIASCVETLTRLETAVCDNWRPLRDKAEYVFQNEENGAECLVFNKTLAETLRHTLPEIEYIGGYLKGYVSGVDYVISIFGIISSQE